MNRDEEWDFTEQEAREETDPGQTTVIGPGRLYDETDWVSEYERDYRERVASDHLARYGDTDG